ncbi:MAG: mechanosensitive ion channel family protein, partial [Mycobacterium sp.]
GVLQVTDAIEGYVRVRMLVSAPNAPALFDLRCDVREGMVAWLQRTHPGALPRRRIEHQTDVDRKVLRPDARASDSPSGPQQADSGLFSGSKEAEQRGRQFDEDVEYRESDDRQFAQAPHRG